VKRQIVPFVCLGLIAFAMYGMYATASREATAASPPEDTAPVYASLGIDDLEEPSLALEDLQLPLEEIPRSAPTADESGILMIREKLFIQQCNDVYLNPDEYVGRTIRLEGIYDEYLDEESGETSRYVIRYGPGCCGYDGMAGFEFMYDGETKPKQDDWIEATGIVELVGPESESYVVLRLSGLRVMDTRGEEYVSN
jgi:hypothetical protein